MAATTLAVVLCWGVMLSFTAFGVWYFGALAWKVIRESPEIVFSPVGAFILVGLLAFTIFVLCAKLQETGGRWEKHRILEVLMVGCVLVMWLVSCN